MRVTSYPPPWRTLQSTIEKAFRKPRLCSLYSLAYDDRKRKRIYVFLIPQGGKFFYLCTRTITQEPKHARKRGGKGGNGLDQSGALRTALQAEEGIKGVAGCGRRWGRDGRARGGGGALGGGEVVVEDRVKGCEQRGHTSQDQVILYGKGEMGKGKGRQDSQKEEGVGAMGDAGLGVAAVPRPVAIMRRIVRPSSWISTGFLTCSSGMANISGGRAGKRGGWVKGGLTSFGVAV